MSDLAIILSERPTLAPVQINPVALQLRDAALSASALIGAVKNAEQNNACVTARKDIRNLLSLFESQRKKFKEPILEAGRQVDRAVESEIVELEKESGRLEMLEKDFIRAEMRRKQEEEELQRRELARIQAEKDAELKRIADEQREREEAARRIQEEDARKVREAAAAAAKLAAEATNKKQREAAEVARVESERLAEATRIEWDRMDAVLKAESERAAAATQRVEEAASNATYVESRPVEITRAKGQTVRKKWVIEQINDFQLMKARPDLVRKIEWDMIAINQALAEGVKLPGVTAREDISIGTRGGNRPAIIEV